LLSLELPMPDPLDELLAAPLFGPIPELLFLRAANHCLDVLTRRYPAYRAFLQRRGWSASVLNSPAQLDALPALFLPVLKGCAFSLPDDLAVAVRLTSSGTTGRPSVTPLDEADLQRRVAAMLAGYRGVRLVTGSVEVLAFLIDPAQTQMAGSVVIDACLRATREVRSVRYLVRLGPKGPDFAGAEAVMALREAAARGSVLLVGYPALMAAAMEGLCAAGVQKLPLPPGSRVLTGGGWKSFLPGVPIDRTAFQMRVAEFFGLEPAAVRDMYGLSECPAVFVQCDRGHYRVPAFARARAIDPETNEDVPEGEIGLLELTVPLTTSYPLLKILTTDKVRLTREGSVPGWCLTPCGRTSAARFETCAMKLGRALPAAADVVGRAS
jgi:hypothetical protein